MNAFAEGAVLAETSDSWPPAPVSAPLSLEARGFTVEEGALPDGFYARVARAGMMVEGRGDSPQAALARAAVLVDQLEHVRSLVGPEKTPGDQRG